MYEKQEVTEKPDEVKELRDLLARARFEMEMLGRKGERAANRLDDYVENLNRKIREWEITELKRSAHVHDLER